MEFEALIVSNFGSQVGEAVIAEGVVDEVGKPVDRDATSTGHRRGITIVRSEIGSGKIGKPVHLFGVVPLVININCSENTCTFLNSMLITFWR